MTVLHADTERGRVSYVDQGGGPTRVYLHSLLTDRRAFDPVTGALGGRSIGVDLPGFGLSDPAAPDLDDYGSRVASFLASLERSEPTTLIGNGLGAFVALATAIRHGDRFDRLVLVGCGAAFPEPAKAAFRGMIEAVERGGMEAVIPVALRRIFTEEYLREHPERAEERAEVLRRTDPAALVTACQALTAVDYREEATRVRNPTLIVVGEEDAATPPALAEELHRLIPGSELVLLPGLAHAPQIQDPAAFVGAVQPFVEAR